MVKISARRRKSQGGQAILIVVLAMSIFLLGAVGFAIDGSHLYAQRQMAQAAADAAAEAGILSIFDGTSSVSGNPSKFSCSTTASDTTPCFTCTQPSDARTPCYYAQTMNGFNGASDVIKVYFPTAAGVGVNTSNLSGTDPVNLLKVSIERPVNTTLMRFIGPSASTIGASGTAAIVSVAAPVPILVTHPTMSGSFKLGGSGSGPKITICGGPSRSIEVNSSSATSMTWTGNPVVDLSHAGPLDPGNCTSGTGADFGDFGGPSSGGSIVTFGTLPGSFIQPASPIQDPLATVAEPSDPGFLSSTNSGTPPTVTGGTAGCPPPSSNTCNVYSPGKYTNGIDIKNQMAVFKPGIYYMYGADFKIDSNGIPYMATGYTDSGASSTGTSWTGNMLVYMTGPLSTGAQPTAGTGTFTVDANAGKGYPTGYVPLLIGSPSASTYKNIFLFVDRQAATNTNSIDGGASVSLTGTLYSTSSYNTATIYQTLHFQGNGSGTTLITGEIITSAIDLQGTPGILMNLNPNAVTVVRQVALVN